MIIKIFAGASTYRAGTWTSKEFEFPTPARMSCGRAWTNTTGSLSVALTEGNGDAIYSRTVTDERPFRLQGGQKYRSQTVTLTLNSGKVIHRLELAKTVRELRGG